MIALYTKSKSSNREIQTIDLNDDEIMASSTLPSSEISIDDLLGTECLKTDSLPLIIKKQKSKPKVDKQVYLHRKRLLYPDSVADLNVHAPDLP